MYIFTGDRITEARFTHAGGKEIDERPCFFGSRLTFEEGDREEESSFLFNSNKTRVCTHT